MKLVEKVLSVKPDAQSIKDIIFYPQINLKVKKVKIDRDSLLNVGYYSISKELEERLNKSITLKKFIKNTKKQKIDNLYLKRLIGARDLLNLGMKFLKELEKLQKDSKVKTLVKITDRKTIINE